MADCYKQGIGSKVEYEKAMEQYLHLAEHTGCYWKKDADGIGMALDEISNMYLNGSVVPIDLRKDAKYFRLAAMKGNQDTENALANKKFIDFKR